MGRPSAHLRPLALSSSPPPLPPSELKLLLSAAITSGGGGSGDGARGKRCGREACGRRSGRDSDGAGGRAYVICDSFGTGVAARALAAAAPSLERKEEKKSNAIAPARSIQEASPPPSPLAVQCFRACVSAPPFRCITPLHAFIGPAWACQVL